MKKLLVILIFVFFTTVVSAQVPYFSGTPGDGNMYGYTSLKFRPGINAQESYTCFQYGVTDYMATGVDLYAGNNSTYIGVLVRGGYRVSKWFGIGGQATPSFNLNKNMELSYFTGAIYMNGNITENGELFWCSNTWFGINRGASNSYSQWTFLGYTIPTYKGQSITPMIGEIHSWKFDQDLDMALGAYYSIGKFNFYVWGNDFFKENPRIVFGIDFKISTK